MCLSSESAPEIFPEIAISQLPDGGPVVERFPEIFPEIVLEGNGIGRADVIVRACVRVCACACGCVGGRVRAMTW